MCACVLPASLAAQGPPAITVSLDNDILAPRGRGAPADYDYTHGLSIGVELDSVSRPAPGRARVGVGQRIYTPRRDAPTPVPGERPYAAWLYLTGELDMRRGGREGTLSAEVGVTGRPALGEPVQNGVHRLLGSRAQEGWSHQLGFEPGLLLRYREGYPLALPGTTVLRVVPGWSVAIGNVRTAADAGIVARLGRAGVYLEGAARHEWVARDLFLDGNTLGGGTSARRIGRVAEGSVSVGYRGRAWEARYRAVVRGREYHAQPTPHAYGSLTLTLLRPDDEVARGGEPRASPLDSARGAAEPR